MFLHFIKYSKLLGISAGVCLDHNPISSWIVFKARASMILKRSSFVSFNTPCTCKLAVNSHEQ